MSLAVDGLGFASLTGGARLGGVVAEVSSDAVVVAVPRCTTQQIPGSVVRGGFSFVKRPRSGVVANKPATWGRLDHDGCGLSRRKVRQQFARLPYEPEASSTEPLVTASGGEKGSRSGLLPSRRHPRAWRPCRASWAGLVWRRRAWRATRAAAREARTRSPSTRCRQAPPAGGRPPAAIRPRVSMGLISS